MVHVADAAGQLATHRELAASAAGDLAAFFAGLAAAASQRVQAPAWASDWLPRLAGGRAQAVAADAALLAQRRAARSTRCGSTASWAGLLDDDAVVIGDGGDFVSYAGKYIEPQQPGGWLDPGPVRLPGHRARATPSRPGSPGRPAQVVLLLGDGAAGFSLMDVDTLVRHSLPVVMICGNNGIWGLEKHPMQALYGYDVAADLQPRLPLRPGGDRARRRPASW